MQCSPSLPGWQGYPVGFIYPNIFFWAPLTQQGCPPLCKCYPMLLSSRAWRLGPHLDGAPVERGYLGPSALALSSPWWEVTWGSFCCPEDLDCLCWWLPECWQLPEWWWLLEHCWLMEWLISSIFSSSIAATEGPASGCPSLWPTSPSTNPASLQ